MGVCEEISVTSTARTSCKGKNTTSHRPAMILATIMKDPLTPHARNGRAKRRQHVETSLCLFAPQRGDFCALCGFYFGVRWFWQEVWNDGVCLHGSLPRVCTAQSARQHGFPNTTSITAHNTLRSSILSLSVHRCPCSTNYSMHCASNKAQASGLSSAAEHRRSGQKQGEGQPNAGGTTMDSAS